MGAYGADPGGCGAHDDVAAVAALPHPDPAFGKNLPGLHIAQQRAEALLVVLFHGAHGAESGGQSGEALGLGGDGVALVPVGPLEVFAVRGRTQIPGGGADAAELPEPQLGVGSLPLGSLAFSSSAVMAGRGRS